jgi:prepilin-type N-terminal cleavage/methylation domain-containing protein
MHILNKKFNTKSGFTLIELLVVIAIIAILASIIIGYLGSSKNQANDSKVKQQTKAAGNAAEIYFVNHSNTYLAAADCVSGLFTDNASNMAPVMTSLRNVAGTTNVDCGANATQWSIAAKLPGGSGSICVDSTSAGTLKSYPGTTPLGVGGPHASNSVTCN